MNGQDGALPMIAEMLTLAASLGTAQPGEGTSERSPQVEILRKDEQDVVEGPEEYFTGRATIRANFSREDPSRVTGAIVSFEPGARTAWHSHPLGQTLIVTEGVGWTQIRGGPRLEFEAGDIMLCPEGIEHWHGATPDSSMTHIAIQEAKDGSPVSWGEKVTEEEYLGG